MQVHVTQDTEYACWNYRIIYPGGGSLGGSGYATELLAWRAAALHLATLVNPRVGAA